MKGKGLIGAIGATILSVCLWQGVGLAQNLDAQLQNAVNAENWTQAIALVDRLIVERGASEPLTAYRRRLVRLQQTSNPTASAPATASRPVATAAPLTGNISLQQMSDALNQALPLQIDEDAELLSTSVVGNTFIYDMRFLNISAQETSPELMAAVLDSIFSSFACEDASITSLLDEGISLRFNVKDINYAPVTDLNLHPDDCGT